MTTKKINNYVNLNVQTTYSFLNSLIKVTDLINFSVNHQLKYCAIADENVMYGAIAFYQACLKNNLTPVIGMKTTYQEYECILFALNYEGYKNLIKISSFIQLKQPFKLPDYLTGLAIIDLKQNLPNQSEFYYTLDPKQLNYIACQSSKYLNATDYADFVLLQAIKANKTINDDENIKKILLADPKIAGPHYLLDEKEAIDKFSETGLKNLNHLLTNVNLNIPFNENHLLKFPLPTDCKTAKTYLKRLASQGLKHKLKNDLVDKAYVDRLKYELEVIHDLGFDDYFLIVHEYVSFAKKNHILVGPGRGSAVGSLVAYALDITTIDPLKYHLIFERFLNKARKTMPDIDIDIADNKRQELINHLFEFYNDGNKTQKVSYLITFQTIQIKTAIRDIARTLNLEQHTVDQICKLIPLKLDNTNNEEVIKKLIPNELYESHQLLFSHVFKFIGLYRQYSMHAAGIVLSDVNLYDIIPIQLGNNNEIVTQYSMEYLESLGLLKMDLLGLSNLTLIQNIIDLIKIQCNEVIDLNNLDLTDQDVYQELSKGDTFGVFQFESPGMTKLLTRVKPTCIEDLAMTSAMFRPGPQSQIAQWIKNRADPKNIKYDLPQLESILAPTAGMLVYQEQVMEIAVKVAGFSLQDADLLRRAISKKHANELASLKEKFINGSIQNKIDEKEANKIYDYVFEFASYGFNHSHAVAYAFISYWLAYFKVHYALQFIQAYLLFKPFKDNAQNILTFASLMHIKLFAPSIINSKYDFTYNNKLQLLYFGFSTIKGVGQASIDKLIELVKIATKNLSDPKACLFASIKIASAKLLETLILAGCYDELCQDRNQLLIWLDSINAINSEMVDYDQFANLDTLLENKIKVRDFKPLTNSQLVKAEFDLLGYSRSLLNSAHNQVANDNNPITNLADKAKLALTNVLLLHHKEKRDKKGRLSTSCLLEKDSFHFTATIPFWKYQKYLSTPDFFKDQDHYDITIIKNGFFLNIEDMKKTQPNAVNDNKQSIPKKEETN